MTSNSFDLVFQEFSSGGAFVFERICTFCVSCFVFLFFFFYCVLFPIIHLLRNIELLRAIIMFNGDYVIEKSLLSFMIGNFFNLFQPQTKYSFFFRFIIQKLYVTVVFARNKVSICTRKSKVTNFRGKRLFITNIIRWNTSKCRKYTVCYSVVDLWICYRRFVTWNNYTPIGSSHVMPLSIDCIVRLFRSLSLCMRHMYSFQNSKIWTNIV